MALQQVLPGRDGSLAIWAVLGPSDKNLLPLRKDPTLLGALRPADRPAKWRSVSTVGPTWRLLGPKTRSKRTRHLFLALILEPRSDSLIRLSATGNGDMEIRLNGKSLVTRSQGRFARDSLMVPLSLRTGRNILVVRMDRPGPYRLWKGRFRFLDRSFHPVTDQAALFLPSGLAAQTQLKVTVTRHLGPDGLSAKLSVHAPGGMPLPKGPLVLDARLTPSRTGIHRVLNPIDLARKGLDLPIPRGFSGRVRVTSPLAKTLLVRDRKRIAALWRMAKTALDQSPQSLPKDSRDSLRFHLDRLRRLLESGDRDRAYLLRLARLLARWCAWAKAGRDPFARMHGRVVMAVRSSLDGSLQPYSLWIPRGAHQRRRMPLYVMLHGLECSHRKGLNQMLGVWMPREDPTTWSRFTRRLPPPKVSPRALVLAPQAFGDSFYRHEGEVAVFEAIEAVRRRFDIDPNRIILVGHSMGGTGVLALGLKHPDFFAGMVSLSGYPSRWIYPSVRRGPLRPWELADARTWSPILWVSNGRHLPLIAVHGTRDHADRAEALVRAYQRAGGRAWLRLFEEGHSVWRQYLADGRIYRQTGSWRRRPTLRRISFQTTRLRWNKAGPLSILATDRFDRWARVTWSRRAGKLLVHTDNVTAIALDGKRLRPHNLSLVLDGQDLSLQVGLSQRPRVFERNEAGAWHRAKDPTSGKRPGLSGPIDDIYYGPVIVVRGTRKPSAAGLMDLLAAHFSRHQLSSIHYQVIEDRALTPALAASANLILLGGPSLNSVTARLAGRLPIGLDTQGIHLGARTISKPNAAALFIAPNPEQPNRYVLVLAGNSDLAMVHALALPKWLPDWVVFDETIQRSGLPRILGPERRYLAAGWFDAHWRLPNAHREELRSQGPGAPAPGRPARSRNAAPRPPRPQ